jgi:hemoglobin-like flavoprotein
MNFSSAAQNRSISPLNAEQVALLRRTFASIESKGTIAALVFYRNLFTLDPSLKAMFHTSIELQARKLMESLAYTVASLEEPQKLIPALEAMGRRHVSYGVRDEHYATVMTALLQMFEETLGKNFTPEAREAWQNALEFVSSTMQRGAAEVPDPSQQIQL